MRKGKVAWGAVAVATAVLGVRPGIGWAEVGGAAPPTPHAAEVAVYDPASGRFLLTRDADRPVPVASLVKLMTVRLALESGSLDRSITVPAGVTALPETKVGLVPGEQVPMRVLISALMVRSANDAAYTIATALGGSEAGFAQAMNAEALRLGLLHTHYVNSSGLDAAGQYSSAGDVARLAAADLSLTGFGTLVDQRSVSVDGREYGTVNPFLAYYPTASGIKTGFTSDAMFCLAGSAERGGRTLIAVVLGEPNWGATDADAAALLDWGFAQVTAGSGPAAAAPSTAVAPPSGPVQHAHPPSTAASAPLVPPASIAPDPGAQPSETAPRRTAAPGAHQEAAVVSGGQARSWAAAGVAVAALAGALGVWLRRR